MDPSDYEYAECRSAALTSSTKVISEVLSRAKESQRGTSAPDLEHLPPFASFIIDKAAIMVLESQRVGEASLICFEALDSFKNTPRLISQRWLAASKSTTSPTRGRRLTKVVEQYLQTLEDL
jgi:hypothetical protein